MHPRAQTEPVARWGDAADDPAIWVPPQDPTRSRMLGTNKKQGLLVYDLEGRQRQLLEVGRINNVDLRQRVQLGAGTFDVAVATQRDEGSLVVFTIDGDGEVSERMRVPTGLKDVYGVCLYQPAEGGLEVFVNDKDGSFQRWRLQALRDEKIEATLTQRFRVASQPEACVADDARKRLFIGEEKRGVWVMPLDGPPGTEPKLELALPLSPLLHADVEGIALYRAAPGDAGYLVVSSQGNDSYVVAEATPPYRVRGAFRVALDARRGIDGTAETDGLEVSAAPLGGAFSRGLLVVQDGYKRLPDGPQNFKYVAWEDVARVLRLP